MLIQVRTSHSTFKTKKKNIKKKTRQGVVPELSALNLEVAIRHTAVVRCIELRATPCETISVHEHDKPSSRESCQKRHARVRLSLSVETTTQQFLSIKMGNSIQVLAGQGERRKFFGGQTPIR